MLNVHKFLYQRHNRYVMFSFLFESETVEVSRHENKILLFLLQILNLIKIFPVVLPQTICMNMCLY